MALDGRATAQTVSKEILKSSVPFLTPFVEGEHEAQIAILNRVEEFCGEKPDLIKTKRVTALMKVRPQGSLLFSRSLVE